jgi:hypothetical protein
VTSGALFRGWLVEEHGFALEWLSGRVASLTTHAFMSSCQGEAGTPLVVEERWLPLGGVVALGTRRNAVSVCELLAVNVVMALLAFVRRRLKIDIHHSGFHVGWLMTINAGGAAVRTQKRKAGFGVIEFLKIFPGDSGMACFATGGRAVGTRVPHTILELAFMRIVVTDSAAAVLEAVQHQVRLLRRGTLFMTIAAGSRDMAARQNEACFLMAGQGKG